MQHDLTYFQFTQLSVYPVVLQVSPAQLILRPRQLAHPSTPIRRSSPWPGGH